MPAKNEDLHGNVPDNAAVALLLIDVINDRALQHMQTVLEADTRPSAELVLENLL